MADLKFPPIKDVQGNPLSLDDVIRIAGEPIYLPFEYGGAVFHLAVDPLKITAAQADKLQATIMKLVADAGGEVKDGSTQVSVKNVAPEMMAAIEQARMDLFLPENDPAVLGWDFPQFTLDQQTLQAHELLRKPVLAALEEWYSPTSRRSSETGTTPTANISS